MTCSHLNTSYYNLPIHQIKECLKPSKIFILKHKNPFLSTKIETLTYQTKTIIKCKDTSSKTSITSEFEDIKIKYLDKVCGQYILKNEDINIFKNFQKAMSKTINWLLFLSFLNIARLVNIIISNKFKLVYLFGSSFRSIQILAIASIFMFSQKSFTYVIKKAHQNKNSLPNIIDGMQKLSVGFQYLAFISSVVTILFTMEASARCPDVVLPFSVFLVVIAIIRFLSLILIETIYKAGSGGVMHLASAIQRGTAAKEGYPWLHRIALRLSLGNILAYSFISKENYDTSNVSSNALSNASSEYEFSEFEENVVRIFIDSMRIASVGYLFQTLANIIKGLMFVMIKEYKSLIDISFDLYETIVAFALFLSGSIIFDKILATKGKDISNLLEGFDTGLTKLFEHLTRLFKSVCYAIIFSIVLQYVDIGAIFQVIKSKILNLFV